MRIAYTRAKQSMAAGHRPSIRPTPCGPGLRGRDGEPPRAKPNSVSTIDSKDRHVDRTTTPRQRPEVKPRATDEGPTPSPTGPAQQVARCLGGLRGRRLVCRGIDHKPVDHPDSLHRPNRLRARLHGTGFLLSTTITVAPARSVSDAHQPALKVAYARCSRPTASHGHRAA